MYIIWYLHICSLIKGHNLGGGTIWGRGEEVCGWGGTHTTFKLKTHQKHIPTSDLKTNTHKSHTNFRSNTNRNIY